MRTKAIILVLCIGLLLCSCATKAEPLTITEIEFKPITLDISDSVTSVFETRPILAPDLTLNESASPISQAVYVALMYKQWGENWQDYAIRLENFILMLQETLLNESEDREKYKPT